MRTISKTIFFFLTLWIALPAFAGTEIPRMTPNEVVALQQKETVVMLDVRRASHFSKSTEQITGAIRVKGDIVQAAKSFPKDQVLVLYCA